MAKVCCACGSDISKRVHARRSLGTAKSSGVLQVWRKMLKKFGREELEQKILNETGSLLMCHKCFSAYDRYYRLEVEIENTLLKTFHEESEGDMTSQTACLVPPSTSLKRPRPSISRQTTPTKPKRLHVQSSTSPGVSVSYCFSVQT